MRLFDACCYVGRWPTERLAYHTAQGLLAEMDRLSIARALVAHTLSFQDAPSFGNARLMEEVASIPRLEPCWVVLPGETLGGRPGRDAATLCDTLASQSVRAVRLCPRDHVYPLTDWMVGDLLAALAERNYLLLIDLDQVVLPTGLFDVDPAGWTHVAWLCQSFPQLSVVLTKVGYRALRILPRLMREFPNLHVDLSYFSTHLGVEEIVAEFSAERLLFGTNQPLTDPGGAITRLAYAEITANEREQIAHGNLERLLDRVQVERLGSTPATADTEGVAVPVIGMTGERGAGSGERGAWSGEPGSRSPERSEGTGAPQPLRTSAQGVQASEHTGEWLPLLVRAGLALSESGIEIIDAHIHLGPYRNFYIPDPSASAILRVMDRCGVARAGMASTMSVGPDWITGNRLTAEAVAAHPNRFFGYAVANPNESSLITAELTHAFDGLGLVAIKLHPDLHAHPIGGKGYAPAWEFASERGCPIFSHTFHGSRFCDPTAFSPLADRYPNVPIILVHSGSLSASFESAIRLAQEHDNIYLDLSGSYVTGPWIKRMVHEAGADRVLFSSDVPFIDLRYSLGRVVFAQLTREEQALVLGGNIRRLLQL